MNKVKVFLILLMGIVFTIIPFAVNADQISPNPNPSGNTITVSTSGGYNNDNPFTNYGNLLIDTPGTLTNNGTLNNSFFYVPGSNYGSAVVGTLNNNGMLINNGTLNNGTYRLDFSTLTNNGTMLNNGMLHNYQVLNNYGLLINNSGGTLFNEYGGLFNSGTTINNGTMTSNDGSVFNNSDGTLINNGTLDNSRFPFMNEGTLINNGTLIGERSGNSGTLINASGGTLNGSLGNSSGGTLINNGTLSGFLNNSGTITGTGNFQTSQGGGLINNGSMTQASIQINGGTLSGTGTINGAVSIASGARVSPGNTSPGTNTPGTLTINGNFSSSGDLFFEIGGEGNGYYDVLDINGSAIFTGGTIEFDFINGYDAKPGDHWYFLFADSLTGWDWDTLSFIVNGLDAGLSWQLKSPDDRGEMLLITAAPEPATLLFLGLGMIGLAGARRKFKGQN